jgi:hypothetical protein
MGETTELCFLATPIGKMQLGLSEDRLQIRCFSSGAGAGKSLWKIPFDD